MSERLGLPTPIVLSERSVDHPSFLRAFNKYASSRQRDPSLTDKKERRIVEGLRERRGNDEGKQSPDYPALPKTRSKLRLISRPALRTPLSELFGATSRRQPRKRRLFGASADDSPNAARKGGASVGGRPITRSLTRKGEEEEEERTTTDEGNLGAVFPKRRQRREAAPSLPSAPPLSPSPLPADPPDEERRAVDFEIEPDFLLIVGKRRVF